MLLIIGTIIILIYTIACLIKIYRSKEDLKNMTGMVLAMLVATISSTTIGLILGILFRGDLTTSTIIAMNFSLIVGIIAGKAISLIVIGESVGMGAMGGMMGAMIGDMIPSNSFSLIVVYFVIFSIIGFLFILHVLDTKVKQHKENIVSRPWKTRALILVTIMFSLVILGYVEMETIDNRSHLEENEMHHHH